MQSPSSTFFFDLLTRVVMPLNRLLCRRFRVEIYSCKLVTNEKRLYKQLNGDPENDPQKLEPLSPPESCASYSCSPSKFYSKSWTSEEGDSMFPPTLTPTANSFQQKQQISTATSPLLTTTTTTLTSHAATTTTIASSNYSIGANCNQMPNNTNQLIAYSGNAYANQNSIPSAANLISSFNQISRKTLFYLIATLNASFGPDYEFSKAKAEEFSREPSYVWVMNAIDANFLSSPAHQSYSALKPQLWQAIDKAIAMSECEIYSYNPDLTSDPYSEDGCLWSFNYIFYNKKMKRVLFFTCRSTSTHASDQLSNADDCDDNYVLDLDDCSAADSV